MATSGIRSWARNINRHWEFLDRKALDAYVSKRLPECDVFVGLSGSALRTGKVAQRRGAKYVCDRGSTHISSQNQLLREEHELWGRPFRGIDPRIIEQEMAEYATADCITVPSSFNVRTFLSHGVPAAKIKLLPYGVDLSRFNRTGTPDANRFDILFAGNMSLRKGMPYLLRAYQLVQHPLKSLTLAGSTDSDFIVAMQACGLWPDDVRVLGHVAQPTLRDIMSRSHALVLPSIEEGLAMVQAQAMACACPVVATENTGSQDLFDDGREGFIVPIRDAAAIAERLQRLADDPALRLQMSDAALNRVKRSRGWSDYGDSAFATYQSLAA
jgi:glycosyltransferase involved in cell wall biosynthesis